MADCEICKIPKGEYCTAVAEDAGERVKHSLTKPDETIFQSILNCPFKLANDAVRIKATNHA